jgi:hypothetical protein
MGFNKSIFSVSKSNGGCVSTSTGGCVSTSNLIFMLGFWVKENWGRFVSTTSSPHKVSAFKNAESMAEATDIAFWFDFFLLEKNPNLQKTDSIREKFQEQCPHTTLHLHSVQSTKLIFHYAQILYQKCQSLLFTSKIDAYRCNHLIAKRFLWTSD